MAGAGQFHIICPIEKYIKGSKKQREAIRRFRKIGVSLSFKNSSSEEKEASFSVWFAAPFGEAPYPASSTAAIISCAAAFPSTPIELVSRLTEQEVTPVTFETAFSTRALQAAQLIPVTLYCFTVITHLRFLKIQLLGVFFSCTLYFKYKLIA